MTLEDRDFIRGAAAWTAQTNVSAIDFGLSPDEALHRAPEFLRGLREGKISPAVARIDDASIDVLYAACQLLAEPNAGGVEEPLVTTGALYDFIEKVTWPGPDFDERAELLATCAFAGWRIARRKATSAEIEQWQFRLVNACSTFPHSREGREESPIQECKTDPIFSAETLLPLLDALRAKGTSAPAEVLAEVSFLYEFLEKLEPHYPTDAFILDEREYFLGEAARIAGTVCRQLSLQEEGRRWLDLADGWFLQTENASGNIARVGFQRLALRTEERDFASVLELLPKLVATFRRLGMSEDAVKCRFLEVMALKENDRLSEVTTLLGEIAEEAKALRNDSLLAYAYVNSVQVHGALGEAERALALAQEAAPLLRKLNNRVGLAKLYCGIGFLQKHQSDATGALETLRTAQHEFAQLSMRADVAAVQLVIADLLLDVGQEKQAEREICQALPLIDEYKLVPEGFAAMTLLRESLRRQKIDRSALRNLHDHFEKKKL